MAVLANEYVFIPLIVVGLFGSGWLYKKVGGSLNPFSWGRSNNRES